MMNLVDITIKNYVIVNDELIEIRPEIIALSRDLGNLSDVLKNKFI